MQKDANTIEEKMIEVGDSHTIYTQLWGSGKAKDTILFLHGGPGSGCSDSHKQMFNPQKQRVLFFDQRGSGQSLPKGSLENNTTDKLVADIVMISKEYGVKSFVVTGGSWGSTLALVLAIRKPEMVKSLVLRGIFTARQQETDFLENGGYKDFFPDVWQRYREAAPEKYRDNPREYHIPRILGDDEVAAKQSAYEYDILEGSLLKRDDRITPQDFKTYDKSSITIEVSYLANDCYLDEGYILDNASQLKMPLYIIQGRYDFVCPPVTAYELHKAVSQSQLIFTDAGHSGGDRSNWEVVKSILETISS